MSGIQGIAAASRLAGAGRAASASGGAFSVPEGAGTAGAAASGSVAGISLAGLLALQESGGEAVADREARRRGHDLLSELAGLQRDLLADGPQPERLQRLGNLLNSVPSADDPRLRAVVDDIRLRVRIELARYGMFAANDSNNR